MNNNQMKCCIFSRTSTTQQDVKQQTNILVAEAEQLGYSNKNIIILEYQESGIKLSVEERQGIQKLKEAIIKDNSINCVLCWELTRIGRRADVIYNIRDFLLEHKVRWIVLKPSYVEIIDKDGNQSQISSLLLGIFGAFAESEMMLKKERFKRAKDNLKSQGKKFTGLTVFGYMVDKDKNCIPHPIHSKIVVDLFNYYINSKDASLYETYKYATSKYPEFFPVIEYKKSQHRMRHIMTYRTYAYGNEIYKPLIPVEIFEKARQKLKVAKNVSRYSTRLNFLGRGKVRCAYCNTLMSPASGSIMGYICTRDTLHNAQINAAALDWIIWEEVRVAINVAASIDNSAKVIQINNQIKDKQNLSLKTQEYIKELREKQDKIVSLYLENKINKSTYDKKYVEITSELTDKESEYNILLQQINELEVTLDGSNDLNMSSINVDNITDLKMRQQYVREYVENVWVEKQDKLYKVWFDWKKNLVLPRSTYLYTGWGGYKKIWRVNEDGTKDYIYCERGKRPERDQLVQ